MIYLASGVKFYGKLNNMANTFSGYKWGERSYIEICLQCNAKFKAFKSVKRKFCSRQCFYKSGISHRDKPHTQQTKQKLSIMAKNNPKVMAATFKPGHRLWDHPNSRKNWFKKGQRPVNYAGGTRSEYQRIKDDSRYKKWQRKVFERDNYKCVDCGVYGAIHGHHIRRTVDYPELAYEVSNGLTLCPLCHGKRHRK